jgi:hypothetical protein
MGIRGMVLSSAVLLPLLAARPAQAQRVSADIIIGGGPIAGRIHINDGDRYRPRPRIIRRVEWIRARDFRRNDWFRKSRRDMRVVVVYYDNRDDCYYEDRYRPGLQEIRVYERDGRYYRLEDDRFDDRYGRDDRRYDDRYGRDDRRYDDRSGRDNRRPDDRPEYDHN